MAKYLDYAGLQRYDGKIKDYAVTFDSLGTSTTEQTLLDNYYTKTQIDNKLSYSTEWQHATPNTDYVNASSSLCDWFRNGNTITVTMNMRITTTNFSGREVLYTGLPQPKTNTELVMVNNYSGAGNLRIRMSRGATQGQIEVAYPSISDVGDNWSINFSYLID